MAASVFTWHTRPPGGGSILADYNIESVRSVSTDPSGRGLRTLVLYATHRNKPDLKLAIKISPIYRRSDRREDFVREQQIHYLLTQLDATETREAAKKSGSGDMKLFKAKKADPLEHEARVAAAMLTTVEFNVVPLYDFVIQEFALSVIPQVEGRNKLGSIDWIGSHPASFLVQRRLDGILPELLVPPPIELRSDAPPDRSSKDLKTIVEHMMYAILQVCCTLHLLLPLAFTHGDTHAMNIGFIDTGNVPRHYRLSPNKLVRIPRESPHIMLLDFDRSRAEMIDATGKKFEMVPSQESLDERYKNVVKLSPAQTFFPAVDVFRLVHSMLMILADRVTNADVTWTANFVGVDSKWNQFASLCKAGISKLPEAITTLDAYKKVNEFVDELSDGNTVKIQETARNLVGDQVNQKKLWYRLYAESPGSKKDSTNYLMPWDVLEKFPVNLNPEANSVDMTLAPLYARGKVYKVASVTDESNASLRVHPLRTAFPDEFK